jgi:hypothetical protein
MTSTETGFHCRWAIRRDFPDLLAFCGRSEDWLTGRLRRHDTIGMAAEDRAAGRVVALVLYRLRPGYWPVVHLSGSEAGQLALLTALGAKLARGGYPAGLDKLTAGVSERCPGLAGTFRRAGWLFVGEVDGRWVFETYR